LANGRYIRIFRELLLAYVCCVAAAVVVPLSFWHDLGISGAAFIALGLSSLIVAAILYRNRPVHTRQPDLLARPQMAD
jgi:predicted membrane channel-forming protein YqfA (hemolysin III family)